MCCAAMIRLKMSENKARSFGFGFDPKSVMRALYMRVQQCTYYSSCRDFCLLCHRFYCTKGWCFNVRLGGGTIIVKMFSKVL